MTEDWTGRCHFGDVRDVLHRMINAGVQVQCIVTSPPYWGLRRYLPDGHPDQPREIGQEPTLRQFLDTMGDVFDLARQVLRDDGTLWLNMGDSYVTDHLPAFSWRRDGAAVHPTKQGDTGGLKQKDMVGQPWRLAFELQDRGWWLRQDVIWAKPNPMPESAKDRCTKSHEYLFLLSKSPRYYFDHDAIKEPVSPETHPRLARASLPGAKWDGQDPTGTGRPQGITQPRPKAVKGNGDMNAALTVMPTMRAKRSVWTVPIEGFKGAHFATFPQKLVEPCVLASSRSGDVVLDIFLGSGTTAAVAHRLGRRWIGIDLDARNAELQAGRISPQGALELAVESPTQNLNPATPEGSRTTPTEKVGDIASHEQPETLGNHG